MKVDVICFGLDISITDKAISPKSYIFDIDIAYSAAFIDSAEPSIATRILENCFHFDFTKYLLLGYIYSFSFLLFSLPTL